MHVVHGSLTVLRLYDVAYAIDLARVEALAAAPSRVRLQRAEPKAISFDVAPVELSLGSAALPLAETTVAGTVSARVYEFGAVSLLLRIPCAGMAWDDFVTLANLVARAAAQHGEWWDALLAQVRAVIGPAMERPSTRRIDEDYLIATVNRFDQPITADALLNTIDLAPLLSGETRALAPAARADLLRHTHSYYQDDLVALTWDRAFVLEPADDSDIADVLEVANAQLLELRYYDELLDAELPRMYDRVAEARKALRGLGRRRYATLARELHRLVAEVTEITERVDNALKVTEDVYLARVYASALGLFRVETWSAAVHRKLAIFRDTYTALYDEAATARAEILEVAIVLLIVFEIILALFS